MLEKGTLGWPDMRLLIALLLISALAAGCLDPGDEPTQGTAAPEEEAIAPAPTAYELSGEWSLDAGYGAILVGGAAPLTGDRHMTFDAMQGATVTTTSAWTCASDPLCDMALTIYDEDWELLEYVEGPSPLEVQVESPGGEIHAVMWASYQGSVVVDAQGTYQVIIA